MSNDNEKKTNLIKIERSPEFARLYDALFDVINENRFKGISIAGIIGVLAILQNKFIVNEDE